jgi:arabinoxylan arabinofuranohydrolase
LFVFAGFAVRPLIVVSFVGVASIDAQKFNFTYSNNPPSNPWIRQTPGSDPAAVVWGDTVWVYCSQDANLRLEGLGPNDYKYDYMDGYRALSSTDMVNWVDHGEIFHSRNVSWGIASGGWMWAPSAHWNGKSGSEAKYYLYFPHKDLAGVWRIGVATAPTPAGPFTDIGSPIDGLSGIDPHIFKDDDGQVYLYYNQFEVVKLKDNLIEIAEPVRKIDYGQSNLEKMFLFEEGSFMHKYNGKYYYSYSHWNATEPAMAYYAIGSSPYGPFEWKGALTGRKSGSQDHHSMIQFKGEWYYFTHMDTPWKERDIMNWYGQRRISCYQKMYYNDDGTIRQVNPNAWALNAGEGGPFAAGDGVEYYWDQWYSWATSGTDRVDSSVAIANTTDDQIYRGYRWGNAFTYEIPVENNLEYFVTFKFAELFHSSVGMRKFNVSLEGEAKITDLDVFAKAGGKNIAYDETHTVIVRDHVLNIQFTTTADNAMIAGIYIRPKVTLPSPVQAPVKAPATAPSAPMKAPVATPSAPAPRAPVQAPVPMPTAPAASVPVATPSASAPRAPLSAPVLTPTPPIASVPVATPSAPAPKAPLSTPVSIPTAPVASPAATAPLAPAATSPVSTPSAPVQTAPVPAPVPAPTATDQSPVKPPVAAAVSPTLAPIPQPPARAPVSAPLGRLPTVPPVPIPAPIPVPTGPMAPIPIEPTIPPRTSKPPTNPPTTAPIRAPTRPSARRKYPRIRSFWKWLRGF